MSYSELSRQFLFSVTDPITFAILALLISSSCRRDRQRRRDDFLTALGLAAFFAIGVQFHWLVLKLTPTTIDARLLSIDHSLGLDPNQFSAWMHGQHPHFLLMLGVVYSVLAPVMALSWIVERNHTMRRALLLGAIFCWFLYILFPAVGPIYYSHGETVSALRNCFPSMHFTWALLLALNSHSRLRWPLWVYAGLVGISTIALGQHYVIDLIAALPYTAAIQLSAKSSGPKIGFRVNPSQVDGVSRAGAVGVASDEPGL